jgi:hypothetical protein
MQEPNNVNEMSIRQINAYFREHDESHLFPICGRFDVTERAIRKLRKLRHDGLCVNEGLEYYLTLENMIGEIVNDERNW